MYDQRKYDKPFILPYGPPLGIAYLASTFEKHGFDVKAIDMLDYSWNKVRQTLEEEQPDVVGISCLTEQRASPLEVAKLSKTIKTPPRQLIHNLDDIPFPAYKLFSP